MSTIDKLKLTDVGRIPEDWNVIPFSEAVRRYIDYRGRTPLKLGMSWGGGDILALSANNVQMGRINTEKGAHYGSLELYRKWMVRGECEPGDILLTMEAPLGNVAQIPDARKYILSQRVVLIKTNGTATSDFLAHLLRGSYFQRTLAANATGSTAKGIQRAKLDTILIPVPSDPEEQNKIAAALSEADQYAASLEHLLAKKRTVVQGAMQELLTGRRRATDACHTEMVRTEAGVVPSDWVVSTVGNEFHIALGKMLDADKNHGVAKPYIGNRCVQWGRFDLSDIGTIKLPPSEFARYRIAKGDLVVCEGGEVGRCAIWDDQLPECYYQKALHRLRSKGVVTARLMRYILQHAASSGILSQFVTQTSIAHLPKDKFETVPIAFPSEESERTWVVDVLDDLDRDCAALEQLLEKARVIKEGMMQELLTGRVRLV